MDKPYDIIPDLLTNKHLDCNNGKQENHEKIHSIMSPVQRETGHQKTMTTGFSLLHGVRHNLFCQAIRRIHGPNSGK
ncbi:MAG: hypothetical protein ABIK15_18730 [Pseudomonadota bacterium]